MMNIVWIIPNIFKMFLISNYKLCQAPNTKNSKKNTSGDGEWLLCGVCLCESSSPLFIAKLWSVSLHVPLQPSQGRPPGSARGRGCTKGGSSRHRLRLVGSLVGLGHCYVGGWPGFARYMGLLFILLRGFCFYAFQVAHFDSISMCFMYMHCKTMILQYMWKQVNINNICE